MKVILQNEGLSREVTRFTFFAVQIQKLDRWALHIWFLGMGISFVF